MRHLFKCVTCGVVFEKTTDATSCPECLARPPVEVKKEVPANVEPKKAATKKSGEAKSWLIKKGL